MRNAKIVILVLLLVALFPYLLTCFYALPFADDFCFGWTASENIPFVQKFLNQYLHWNGRYTSDVLVNLHPLTTGSLLFYQCICFVSILSMLCVVFILVRKFLSNNMASVFVALFFLLCYLSCQPNITEGVYWYIGLANYHWGCIFFMLQLLLLRDLTGAGKSRSPLLIASLLLLVVSIGFNEVAAAIIPAYYFAALIYFRRDKSMQLHRILWMHFAVAFIASAFVIFSPGNFTREGVFPEHFKLVHSLLYASMQTVRFIGRWSLSVPFAALSLIAIGKADEVKSDLKNTDYRVLLVLLVFTVFMAAFLPYMATGILGQHRTMNYVFPFFIVLWFSSLISVSCQYRWHVKLKHLGTTTNVFVIALVAIAGLVMHGNGVLVVTDLQRGVFQQYRTEFMERQAGIVQLPLARIPALQSVPGAFKIVDVKSDTTYWVDKCMKRFYTETGIALH